MNRPASMTSPGLILVCLILGCASEEGQWEEAKATNTVEAFDAFLTQHAEGPLADSARARIEALMRIVITGRVVIEDGTPWPGVKLHVTEFLDGECLLLFGGPAPQVETDSAGSFELVVDRAYLEEQRSVFCLQAEMPSDMMSPVWGVVEAEKDQSTRHRIHFGGTVTFTRTEEGVLQALRVEDRPLVFRVPEKEGVMDLGDVFSPGELIER